MANLYSVASPNPTPNASFTIGSVDIVCTAGVETNIVSMTPSLPTCAGVYYPVMWGWIILTFGASVPGSMGFAMRVNNGADLVNWGTNFPQYVANATLTYPVYFAAGSFVQSYPLGAFNLQVSVIANAQPVTVRTSGTVIFGQWMRAPDQ